MYTQSSQGSLDGLSGNRHCSRLQEVSSTCLASLHRDDGPPWCVGCRWIEVRYLHRGRRVHAESPGHQLIRPPHPSAPPASLPPLLVLSILFRIFNLSWSQRELSLSRQCCVLPMGQSSFTHPIPSHPGQPHTSIAPSPPPFPSST